MLECSRRIIICKGCSCRAPFPRPAFPSNRSHGVKAAAVPDFHPLYGPLFLTAVSRIVVNSSNHKMLNANERFWVLGGYFSQFCTQHIFDWDQRRWIGLRGQEDLIGEDEDAIRLLKTIYNQMPPEVVEIRLSDAGTVESVSTNLEDDPSQFVHYPRYLAVEGELTEQNTLRRSQLREVDRLRRCVDLVEYSESGIIKKALFKYQLVPHHIDKVWEEAHIVYGLREHQSFPSFDKFVVDDVELRLLGYTSACPAGETLKDNPHRPFRLSWLEQLTQIVDDLNLKYGVMHQDIAPCNILIDSRTNKIKLLDFDKATQIGGGHEVPNFNDIDGVILSVYQILTLDTKYERLSSWNSDVRKLEESTDWPLKVRLEAGLDGAAIRQYLNDWVTRRRTAPMLTHFSEAAEPLEIPPRPPRTPAPCMWCKNEDGTAKLDEHGWGMRACALQAEAHVVRWERPPDPRLLGLLDVDGGSEDQVNLA